MVVYSQTDPVLTTPPSTAVAAVSDESSFREVDDVFLQTQTRIWIGEVLQKRIDEELNIADLLADGELLFEVSRKIRKILPKSWTEMRCSNESNDPFASRRSGGKYMPYSNVDSFLRVCKALGLAGIDLFSPSDVVEKRNTRKVCMCIRLLSKRARSQHLNVPDFDIVTYTVVMPSNMVGCIRRSWESPRCSSSSFGSPTPRKSRSRLCQSNEISPGNYNSFAEEADEIEDDMMLPSDNSTTKSYDSFQLENSIDSSGESSVVNNYNLNQYALEECSQSRERDDYKQDQSESFCETRECQDKQHDSLEGTPSPAESTGSSSWQQLEYDHQLDVIRFPSFDDPHVHFGNIVSKQDNEGRSPEESSEVGLSYVDPNLEDSATMDDSVECIKNETGVDSHSTVSCDISSVTYANDSMPLYHEEESDGVYRNCLSCIAKTTRPPNNKLQGETPDADSQSWEYDDQLDVGDSYKDICSQEVRSDKVDTVKKMTLEEPKSEVIQYGKEEQRFITGNKDEGSLVDHFGFQFVVEQWDQKGKCVTPEIRIINDVQSDLSPSLSQLESKSDALLSVTKDVQQGSWIDGVKSVAKCPAMTEFNNECSGTADVTEAGEQNRVVDVCAFSNSLGNVVVSMDNENSHKESQGVVGHHPSCSVQSPASVTNNLCAHNGMTNEQTECLECEVKNTLHMSRDQEIYPTGCPENKNEVHCKNDAIDEDALPLPIEKINATEDRIVGVEVSKTRRKPLLKSIVKGTAVVGAIMLFLHLSRRNGRDESNKSGEESVEQKDATGVGGRVLRPEVKTGRKHGVYPAEKLRFSD